MNEKSKIRLILSDFYNWYLGGLTLLVSLPVLAPILLRMGLTVPAKVIYLIYSFFCHQFASRSIHLFDFQYAWCARDTGIWFGFTFVAWLLKFKKIKPIKWYWSIPFMIPMALDGGLQTIFTLLSIQPVGVITGDPLYISNNLMRFITGVLFGIGLSLWISGVLLQNPNTQEENKDAQKDSLPNQKPARKWYQREFTKVTAVFIISLFVYLGMVKLWDITSVNNKPGDFADSIVKTPVQDFFIRRGDGVCPTSGANDLFNFSCFFK